MDRQALHQIGYGMYIVSTRQGEKLNGQIANTVFQITPEPRTIGVCLNQQNLTNEMIKQSKVFSISILAEETPLKFIGTFGFKSGREVDKFAGVNYKIGVSGAPIVLDYAIAYLECELLSSLEVGTHTVFAAKLLEAEMLKAGKPMTYAYYQEVKGGKSPKSAPTFIEEEEKKEATVMKKYKCTVCGYIYDPEKGDPDSGIAPGTSFAALPDDWLCPVCGVGKDQFEAI